MASNRKKTANALPAAAMARTLFGLFLVAVGGLAYVNLQIQQHSVGDDIKALEKNVADLKRENRLACLAISSLESHPALQRWIDQGLVKMQPITPEAIARWHGPAPVLAAVEGIRSVANQELEK